ncbi:transglutaminase family protein [Stenoxybacter acetivorans]|uniref:transglutaminase family protein n=1 Tax=Stenoxybacter acetivorans TaxID=422441 RepID=UPI00055A916A|nr:transglutaminase family protein [Stenoxybacter acetivorans]
MNIHISHETRYAYQTPTKRSIQLLRVTPQNLGHQRVLSWKLVVPCLGSELFDGFGNYCTLLSMHEPHQQLQIQASGEVEIDETAEYLHDERIPADLFLRHTDFTRSSEAIRDLAAKHLSRKINQDNLIAYSADILEHMPYTSGSTQVSTTAAESLQLGKGVCQDHAHVFLAGARTFGVPARYVSGYLYTESDQHLASHAWAEACLNGYWHVFDVSNQLFTPSHHVQLAIGLDYNDAAPIRGVRVGGGHERMDYRVQVLSGQQQQQ